MSSIFTSIYYTDEPLRPVCSTLEGDHSLIGTICTLSFDTTDRFCIGWHDLATGKKLQLLAQPSTPAEAEHHLHAALTAIKKELSLSFDNTAVQPLVHHYTANTLPHHFTVRDEPSISGTVLAIVGDIIFTRYHDRTLALPVGRYKGHPLTIAPTLAELDLPAEQISLF